MPLDNRRSRDYNIYAMRLVNRIDLVERLAGLALAQAKSLRLGVAGTRFPEIGTLYDLVRAVVRTLALARREASRLYLMTKGENE